MAKEKNFCQKEFGNIPKIQNQICRVWLHILCLLFHKNGRQNKIVKRHRKHYCCFITDLFGGPFFIHIILWADDKMKNLWYNQYILYFGGISMNFSKRFLHTTLCMILILIFLCPTALAAPKLVLADGSAIPTIMPCNSTYTIKDSSSTDVYFKSSDKSIATIGRN